MAPRLDLQTLLEDLLGTRNVYFQPPANIELLYPCIIYKRNSANTEFADNKPYRYLKQYQITVVDQDPDSSIPDKIAALARCTFERHFASKNLNHDIFTLFF